MLRQGKAHESKSQSEQEQRDAEIKKARTVTLRLTVRELAYRTE